MREGEGHPVVTQVGAAWITDDLLRDTRRVWSKAYGRVITPAEAVEILMNVKRLAEAVLKAEEVS